VVVDKRDVMTGSSAATTGLLLYETDSSLGELITQVGEQSAVRAWRLGLETIDRIETLCRSFDDDGGAGIPATGFTSAGFTRRPTLYVASSKRDVATRQREHLLRRLHGFDVDWLDRTDLRDRYGFDAPGALYSRGNGEIDCYRFGHHLLAAAHAHGARIYDRTDVERLRHDEQGVILKIAGGHTIRARRLVCAAGYETARYLRRRTGRLHSTWAFVSEPIGSFAGWTDRCLIWDTARPYHYLRTTDDHRVLAGGEDEPFSTRHEKTRLLAKKTTRLVAHARTLFPDLPIEVAYSWAGVFADTEDGLPFIGETPEHADAWFALGYGGNGITFSAIAADLIRDAWLGRPNLDASIFAFTRPKPGGARGARY